MAADFRTPGFPAIITPKPASLKRYGWSESDWHERVIRAGGRCELCGNVPKSGRLVIDHAHVKGFRTMAPEERRKHVRGLVCSWDNAYVIARGTLSRLKSAVAYLEKFHRSQG